MKIGMRKPNFKKSLKARTTGKYKRKFKKQIVPFYGKHGFIKNPKKALYNRFYYRFTFSIFRPWTLINLFIYPCYLIIKLTLYIMHFMVYFMLLPYKFLYNIFKKIFYENERLN